MPYAHNGDVDIYFETMGDRTDPPLLLVMGLGAQLIAWHDDWCRRFVDAGRFVVRFDNRDCGLSTKLDGAPLDLGAVLSAWETGAAMPEAPYLLSDMADDAVAVLDELDIERADIAGASLGGMIVQTMAINHPSRVNTMTSIMSTTGEREFYQWDPDVRASILQPMPTDRDGIIEATAKRSGGWSSPRYFDLADARDRAAAAYDRAFAPAGVQRQTAAIRASGSRADGLRSLKVPSLVIHGRCDTLIKPLGGERTAELIPGANLLVAHDMGHDLPRPLWPLLCDLMISHSEHSID